MRTHHFAPAKRQLWVRLKTLKKCLSNQKGILLVFPLLDFRPHLISKLRQAWKSALPSKLNEVNEIEGVLAETGEEAVW